MVFFDFSAFSGLSFPAPEIIPIPPAIKKNKTIIPAITKALTIIPAITKAFETIIEASAPTPVKSPLVTRK